MGLGLQLCMDVMLLIKKGLLLYGNFIFDASFAGDFTGCLDMEQILEKTDRLQAELAMLKPMKAEQVKAFDK